VCQGSALIVGVGGLGSPCALYLAAAGIGHLGLADNDTVSTSNLHRQIAHADVNVGKHKATSAAAACTAINPHVHVTCFHSGVTPANAQDLCQGFDVIVDCSDNAPTRYLVSDAAVMEGKPVVSGAAVGTEGQLTVYNYHGGPCYRYEPAPQLHL
jgi:adenylyltransferase and sulfurtransferase